MPGVAGRVARWRQADHALTRRTARSALVLAPESREPLVLAGTAMTVWDALAAPADDGALVDRVAGALGVDAGEIRGQVVSTMVALRRAGVVVES
jgi:hypothetical protein